MNKHIFFGTFLGLFFGYFIGTMTSTSHSPDAPTPPLIESQMQSGQPDQATHSEVPTSQEKIIYRDKECPTDPSDETLPAPSLSASVATPLMSNQEGEVRVTWNPVPHASRYRVQVLDPGGKVVKTYTTPRATLYLKELPYNEGQPFTPYSVVLSTINRKNEEGAVSPRYEVRIKPLKNLTAPTINEITVEN